MKTGVVFTSTGGNKMIRAIRSLRRMEPDITVHICFDVKARSWYPSPPMSEFEKLPNVAIKCIPDNRFYVNGIMNKAMAWMKELGYDHVAMFHDDIIFSPFK